MRFNWFLYHPFIVGLGESMKLMSDLMVKLIVLKFVLFPNDIYIFSAEIIKLFFLVVKITYIHPFISMSVICHWPLHQFDIKNIFLHGNLEAKVYIEKPLSLVVRGSFLVIYVVFSYIWP